MSVVVSQEFGDWVDTEKKREEWKMVPGYLLWVTGKIIMLLTETGDSGEWYESGGEKESW